MPEFSQGKVPERLCDMTVDHKRNRVCGEPAAGAIRTINGRTFQTILYWYMEGAPRSANALCVRHFREVALGLTDTFMKKEDC